MKTTAGQLKSTTLRRRLGEVLLQQGQLTPDQLDEAIEYQSIYGGRLGTSLVELGYLSEKDLAQVLSEQLKLRYIKPELLMNVSADILGLVPSQTALEYKVVPYHKEKGRLFLAMSDASNLADIDTLSFQLNHVIIPLAVPEVRLMMALKKHYGLGLTPRFETLARQLEEREPVVPQPSQFQPVAKASPDLENPTETTPLAESSDDQWPLLGEADLNSKMVSGDEDAYFTAAPPAQEISSFSLSQQLANACERNDIARALTNYLGQEFAAGGLFMIGPDSFSGWMGACHGAPLHGFCQFHLPLEVDSVLRQALDNRSHYLGPIPDTPLNRPLLEQFPNAPGAALIIPLMVRDRCVSLLYLQDHLAILERRFAELRALGHKAELAFMGLIIRNKILTT